MATEKIHSLTNPGLSASQERQAAEVYARVLNTAGVDPNKITFTGHSLGGGLAATMAVWFNRPAVVFDPTPSELAAKHQPHVSNVIASLGAGAPQSIKDYSANINAQFAARESRDGGEDVATHYQLKSCSRTYPSTRSMIRYPKTVRKASHDVCRSRKRARSGTRFTPNSIAGCAHKQGASGTFDGKSRLKRSQNQTFLIKGVSA